MDDEQPLTFNDPWSDSDHSTLCLTPLEPGLLEDVIGGAHAGLRAAGPLSWWGGRAAPYCM